MGSRDLSLYTLLLCPVRMLPSAIRGRVWTLKWAHDGSGSVELRTVQVWSLGLQQPEDQDVKLQTEG